MTLTKTPDQAYEIFNWENDSGASFSTSVDGSKREENLVLLYLGRSVVSNWKRLPRNFQRLVFEDAIANVSSSEGIGLREAIARFLHAHGGARDSLNRSGARRSERVSDDRSSGRNANSLSPGQNCH